MALPDRALQVLDRMVQLGFGDRPILFIGHSLGGLLIKQILRKSVDATDEPQQRVASQTRAVLFLATPHAGTALASLASRFHAVFGTTVTLEGLKAHDAHLRDLYDWFRRHAVGLAIETATYYELRGVRGVLPIVDPTSSHPSVGADPVGLDEDHLSIAKPRATGDQVCDAARRLLREHVLAPPRTRPAPGRGSEHRESSHEELREPHRIPHELPPAAEEYFGRPAEVARLTDRLRAGKNAAVVGPAGMGKTALAAEALRAVVGVTPAALAASPFPDGVVFLDLYTLHGQAEATWHALANKLGGAALLERSPARDRATEASRSRRVLVVLEGGEEADGKEGRAELSELLGVLSPENRRLLLTRSGGQAAPAELIRIDEPLDPDDAASLLDSLTDGRLAPALRDRVLDLLDGHPLALTWAGGLLSSGEEQPDRLVADWASGGLARLGDPTRADHTLEWLFRRSVRGLDEAARQALAAASLLARATFPLAAVQAALGAAGSGEATALEALRSLVRRSLLRRSEAVDRWQLTHVLGYRFARKEKGSDPALRERLAAWLRGELAASLAVEGGTGDPSLRARLLEHAAALLRADDDQRLWGELAEYLLYDASDRLVELGRLSLVDLALSAVGGWFEAFTDEKAQEPRWLRERTAPRPPRQRAARPGRSPNRARLLS